jgi:hypothetical protein
VRRCSSKKDATIASDGSISPKDKAPRGGEGREHDTEHHDEQCYLQPDETADFSEDKFDAWTPGRRNGVAKAFDTALNETLGRRQRFGPFVKSGNNQKPRQNDREPPEEVNFEMMSKRDL